jgi:hypothetical protein
MVRFGLKEAKRAEAFAKTREQKETVLAVVSMLNVPNVLKRQVNKKASKLNDRISFGNKVLPKLKEKVKLAESLLCKNMEAKDEAVKTLVDWSV